MFLVLIPAGKRIKLDICPNEEWLFVSKRIPNFVDIINKSSFFLINSIGKENFNELKIVRVYKYKKNQLMYTYNTHNMLL